MAIMPFEGMYVYAAEIMPTSHRQAGLCIGIGMSKLMSGIAPAMLTPLFEAHSHELRYMSLPFAALAVCEVAAALLAWYAPELQSGFVVSDSLEETMSTLIPGPV